MTLRAMIVWMLLACASWAELRIPAGQHYDQDIPHVQTSAQQIRLSLQARLDWKEPAGFGSPMIVTLNGSPLAANTLLNKPSEFVLSDGMDLTWSFGLTWRVPYSNDFNSKVDWKPTGKPLPNSEAYAFVWDVTHLLKPGSNSVRISHQGPPGYLLVVRNLTVKSGPRLSVTTATQSPPQPGRTAQTYVAGSAPSLPYQVAVSPQGGIMLRLAGQKFQVSCRSRGSGENWVTSRAGPWKTIAPNAAQTALISGRSYRIRRTVQALPSHVSVTDRVENIGTDLLGVAVENRLHLAGSKARVLLAGREIGLGSLENPANPSAVAQFAAFSVGLVAENDIFRVHCKNFSQEDVIGLSDPRLGVPAGGTNTLRWSLYPTGGDYWAFINAVRRDWNVNYTIRGPLAIDPALLEPTRLPLALYLVTGGTMVSDQVVEGPERCRSESWSNQVSRWVDQVRTAGKRSQTLIYLHSQICTETEVQRKYPDSCLLDAGGQLRLYPFEKPAPLCLSTDRNSYGRNLMDSALEMLKKSRADGLFLDEINYSVFPYAYQTEWDGCSVDMDGSGRVINKVSSVTLLTQNWKVDLARKVHHLGKVLVGNGPPHTQTLLGLKLPVVCETGSYSALQDSHLSVPWGLGNHDLTNSTSSWAEMTHRMLDYGCLFTPYQLGSSLPHGDFLGSMYPTTPQELRAGVILAKERIITNRSGRFGWKDGAEAKVLVFDRTGLPVSTFKPLAERSKEGWRYTLKLSAGSFAILIKKAR